MQAEQGWRVRGELEREGRTVREEVRGNLSEVRQPPFDECRERHVVLLLSILRA
jgi:hypothetical protein